MSSFWVRIAAGTAILVATSAGAQFIRQHDGAKTRSFHGTGAAIARSFASDNEALATFKEILDVSGLSGLEDRVVLRASADTANAAAFIEITSDGEKRYIAYNVTFMQQLLRKTQNYWSLVAVLAHEIGHHVRFHTVIPGRDHEFELEADYQAGFILRRMGATLEETTSAFQTFPEAASSSHPARSERIQSATLGWLKAGGPKVSTKKPTPASADNELLRAAGPDYGHLVEFVKIRFEGFDNVTSEFSGIPHLIFSFTNLSPKTARVGSGNGCDLIAWKYVRNGRTFQANNTFSLQQNGAHYIAVPPQTTKKISYIVDSPSPPPYGSRESSDSVCRFHIGFERSALLHEATAVVNSPIK